MKHGQKGFSALSTLTKVALTILSLVTGTLTVSEDVFNSDAKIVRDFQGKVLSTYSDNSNKIALTMQDFRDAEKRSMDSYNTYIKATPTYKYTVPVQPTPTPAPKPTPAPAPAPARVCSPGSYSCSGNGRQVCNSSGTGWGSAGTCVCGCSGGTCSTCTVQQTKALTNTIQDFREADQKSMESYEIYIEQKQNDANNTTRICIPGASPKCDGNTRQICNSEGTGWKGNGTCPCGCSGGTCSTCTVQQTKALTNTIQDFREADQKSMESYEIYLKDGNVECNLGEKKCKSNTAYSCNSKGVYVLSQVCSLGCDGSGCKKAECIPYSTKCSGDNKREVCNSNGTGWSYGGTCPCGCNSGVCNRCTEEEIVEKTKTRQDFREADQESMESYDVYVENQKKIEQEKLEERIKALLEFKKIDNESYKEYLKSIGDTGSCTVGQTTCSTLGTISILYKCSDGKNLTAQTTCKNGCNGNTCASYICKPLDTKCIDRDTPARCSSDGMSWTKGSTCSVGCNMETGSCYADSGTVETQKIPTCFKGDGCGEGWYCNGDLVPGTSGSFTSQYCTKEETVDKSESIISKIAKALNIPEEGIEGTAFFGEDAAYNIGLSGNGYPPYCWLDTPEGKACREGIKQGAEVSGRVILSIVGGLIGGPQGSFIGGTIIPFGKSVLCEISGNCTEQEKSALGEELFYELAGAQLYVDSQVATSALNEVDDEMIGFLSRRSVPKTEGFQNIDYNPSSNLDHTPGGKRRFLANWFKNIGGKVNYVEPTTRVDAQGNTINIGGYARLGGKEINLTVYDGAVDVGGVTTRAVHHEIIHALGEGIQDPSTNIPFKTELIELDATTKTVEWLAKAGYPSNHAYIAGERRYFVSNLNNLRYKLFTQGKYSTGFLQKPLEGQELLDMFDSVITNPTVKDASNFPNQKLKELTGTVADYIIGIGLKYTP